MGTAQYKAQAEQFFLDQKRANDAAYVQIASGDINRLGQFEAMRGAGAGLAQGGGNTGLAGLGAQVAVGAAVGSNLAAGAIGVPGVVGGVAPRGAVPAVGAAVIAGAGAELVACPACNAQVPPGKFARSAAAGSRLAKKMCGGCGIELLPKCQVLPEWAPARPERTRHQPGDPSRTTREGSGPSPCNHRPLKLQRDTHRPGVDAEAHLRPRPERARVGRRYSTKR